MKTNLITDGLLLAGGKLAFFQIRNPLIFLDIANNFGSLDECYIIGLNNIVFFQNDVFWKYAEKAKIISVPFLPFEDSEYFGTPQMWAICKQHPTSEQIQLVRGCITEYINRLNNVLKVN